MPHDTIFAAAPVPPSLALPYPLILGRAGLAGFPSPAQDYEGRLLDLNEHLVKRPAATFFIKVTGDSMEGFGIHDDNPNVGARDCQSKCSSVWIHDAAEDAVQCRATYSRARQEKAAMSPAPGAY